MEASKLEHQSFDSPEVQESASGLPSSTLNTSAPLYRSRVVMCVPEPDAGQGLPHSLTERAIPHRIWQLTPQGDYPGGLVSITIKVKGQSESLTGKLYYRTGENFLERDYIWLAATVPTRIRVTAQIPSGTKELLLVLYNPDKTAAIVSAQIKEIGQLQKLAPHIYNLIRYHIRHPRTVVSKAKKALLLLRQGGIGALKERIFKRDNYFEWVASFDTITESDREQMRAKLGTLDYQPYISILLPVYNVPERFLRRAIESVRAQVYTNWQLCIADDNSLDQAVRDVIKEYAALDSRISYVFRTTNGHISEATNSAATLARGEFLGFLDHDDELREHALYMVIQELNKYREADLIFSDEDKITEDGVRHDPYFKSDWNPELLLCHNCVCHFTVVRSSVFHGLNGLRKECDGAQDWDFALRVSEITTPDRIRHIPHILYHWRVIEGSTAKETAAKPYVTAAQIKAVSEHVERRGDVGVKVESLPAISMLRVRYAVPQPAPLVSLIVPTFNQYRLLSQCVEGLLHRTQYTNIELIIVDNRSDDPQTLEYLRRLPERDARVKVIKDSGEFNFSRINNEAVKHAAGSILGFINNDIEVIHPEWLDEMVANIARPDVAAVGARLLFPNGTIQHVGVITGIGGVAGHMFKCMPINSFGYFCRAILPQDLSAVTAACMLVRKVDFEAVGGFDQERLAVAFNDIDLCLKLRQLKKRVVFTPYAELLHHESITRGYEDTPEKKARFQREYKAMQERWGEILQTDPFYNHNLSYVSGDFRLANKKPVWI
jgi:GT2 family glycosyltransferase